MGLQGSAFLALWNDVDPARDAEYNCWHTFEHVPERVGIKGFCAGRRYIARERTVDRYFTLYELEGLGVLSGADYADVVDRPTEWSRSMRPSLRNFQRSPCTTLLTLGTGSASGVATFRVGARAALNVAGLNTARSALESHLESSGIASIHLGLVDADARFPLKNAPSADSAAGGIAYVLIVEGIDRADPDAAASRIVETVEQCFDPMQPVNWKSFDLAFAIERSALRHPTTQRQPARTDLRQRWASGR
jgi:hypothetical protein